MKARDGVIAAASVVIAWDLLAHLRYGAWVTIAGAVIALATGLVKGDRVWSLIGGALVVIGFFLPWLWTSSGDEYPVSFSGWDLAHLPELTLLYLVPVLGGLAVLGAFATETRARLLSLAGGAATLALLAFVYVHAA